MMENQTHMTADEQHRAETFGPLEADPNGRHPNEAGAKLDAGKNRLGLVLCGFARSLQEVGKVGTYGANKYTDNGWMEVPDGEQRYTDAMLRHLMREATGEERDPDTGLHHAAHAAWNALARLDLALRKVSNAEPCNKLGSKLPRVDYDYYQRDELIAQKFSEEPLRRQIAELRELGRFREKHSLTGNPEIYDDPSAAFHKFACETHDALKVGAGDTAVQGDMLLPANAGVKR